MKIVVVTLNTAVDNLIQIPGLVQGDIVRASQSDSYPSGKGVNSARSVAQLGRLVHVVGFIGSDRGLFASLDGSNLKTSFIRIDGSVRQNITLVDNDKELLLHVQTPSYRVSKRNVEKLLELVEETAEYGDVFIVSGSLPEGVPNTIYEKIIHSCASYGGKVVFDSSGKAMLNGLAGQPTYIKPNVTEFEELTGIKYDNNNLKEVVEGLRQLLTNGIRSVFLTLGSKGVIAVCFDRPKALLGNVPIERINAEADEVGCGDSFVAGLAIALMEGHSLEDTVRVALSVGTANLYSNGPGNIDIEMYERFLTEVVIEELPF